MTKITTRKNLPERDLSFVNRLFCLSMEKRKDFRSFELIPIERAIDVLTFEIVENLRWRKDNEAFRSISTSTMFLLENSECVVEVLWRWNDGDSTAVRSNELVVWSKICWKIRQIQCFFKSNFRLVTFVSSVVIVPSALFFQVKSLKRNENKVEKFVRKFDDKLFG